MVALRSWSSTSFRNSSIAWSVSSSDCLGAKRKIVLIFDPSITNSVENLSISRYAALLIESRETALESKMISRLGLNESESSGTGEIDATGAICETHAPLRQRHVRSGSKSENAIHRLE